MNVEVGGPMRSHVLTAMPSTLALSNCIYPTSNSQKRTWQLLINKDSGWTQRPGATVDRMAVQVEHLTDRAHYAIGTTLGDQAR